jgi:hypothetical protein
MSQTIRKIAFTAVISAVSLIAVINHSCAQEFSLYGDIGYNYGFKNTYMDYAGNDVMYGYGSGLGISFGVQLDSELPIFFYAGAGINFALALQYENINGVSNKSSFNFNYKSLSLGIGHMFRFEDQGALYGIRAHGGLDYNFPAKASQTENNNYNGDVAYGNSIGYQFGAKLSLVYKEVFFIEPGFTFRNANFQYSSYDWNEGNGRPNNFMLSPNANHLAISLTVRKMLGN